MKKKILILVGVLAGSAMLVVAGRMLFGFNQTTLTASDLPPAKEEYRKLLEHATNNSSNQYIEGSIRLYDSEAPNTVKEETPFSFTREGNTFISTLGPMQTICDGRMVVQLDTANRYIVVSPVNDSVQSMAKNQAMPFEAMFADTAQFKISATVGGNNEERSLEVTNDLTPEIKTMTIFYDPQTYVIRRAEIIWWKNSMTTNAAQRKETWITKIAYQYPGFRKADIEARINSIIHINKNVVQPNENYQDFRFHSSF